MTITEQLDFDVVQRFSVGFLVHKLKVLRLVLTASVSEQDFCLLNGLASTTEDTGDR